MRAAKTTVLTHATLAATRLFDQPIAPTPVSGYEIHIGATEYLLGALPFATNTHSERDGCIAPSTRIFGTYLHGLFDDDTFRQSFLAAARAFHHLAPAATFNPWQHQREQALDAFAAHVERSLDMPAIFSYAGLTYKARR